MGPPPPTRGSRCRAHLGDPSDRSIPAHAGEPDVGAEPGGGIHPQPGQFVPVDDGTVSRSGGEFDVDQDQVVERCVLPWLPPEREGKPVAPPVRKHIVPSPEERVPDPRPVPSALPAVREQEVAELPDGHREQSTCGPRRVRGENAGPDG